MLVTGYSLLVAGYSLLVAGYSLLVAGSSKENCEGYLLKAKSYRDLEIYKLSYELAMKIHSISLKLPKYELYEEGS